jgi:hypothetical protein
MTPPTPEFERERQRVSIAAHEIGHHLVLAHYKVHSNPEVFLGNGKPLPLGADGQEIPGQCDMVKPYTAYQRAVAGWAGLLAQHLVGVSSAPVMIPLRQANLREWFALAMCQPDLSATDKLAILNHRSPWKTFQSAFRILCRQKDKIVRLAGVEKIHLAASSAPALPNPTQPTPPMLPVQIPVSMQPMFANPPAFLRPSVPVPAAFPASEEDFVQLACANNGDSYSEFVTDRVKRQWRLTGAGADEAKAKIMEAIRQANPGKSNDTVTAIFDEAFKQAVARERESFFKSSIQWQAEWPVGVFEYKMWLVNKSKA